MNVTKIPNVTLTPGDNFIDYEWGDAQVVHAHVTLPPPGPPGQPGCDFAFGVQLAQATIRNGVKGLTIRYQSPNGQPLTNGTLVVYEG